MNTTSSLSNSHINIKPGIAFGFDHPATLAMLHLLRDENFNKPVQRALDLGCGSGILSIYLSKVKNVKKIYALDIDPFVLKEAKSNFKSNIKKKRAAIFLLNDFSLLKEPFHIIVANVPINVHILLHSHISRLLTYKGAIYCGGILKSQKDVLLNLYQDFTVINYLEISDWMAFKLRRF